MADPLNAFLDLPDIAVPSADSGPLAGLTLAVKDIFDVAGYPTGCGNPERAAEARPATRTAPAVQRLFDAGARFFGKTQTEELAFSMIGQNVHFPWPVNPRAPDRVTGGSSSGSAAAVAGGLADIATGSDTGGSVRAPASFCGLIGLRTTHGRISLEGTMPLAPSFDTFGWFASDAAAYAAVGAALLGPDQDSTRLSRPLRIAALDALVAGPAETAEYRRMCAVVAEVLGEPQPAGMPPQSLEELYWCSRRLQAKEAWMAHGRWITEKPRQMGQAVRDRFQFGAGISLSVALEESERRKLFRGWLRALLGDDGVLVMPTVPGAAPLKSSSAEEFAEFRERAILLLCWSGLSGFPQISLPLGSVDGAPFGISLLGPPDSDMRLIDLGRRVLRA